MNSHELAYKVFEAMYDEDDLKELHQKKVIAQPLGFKLSSIATIECEIKEEHDRLTQENAELRSRLSGLIYASENNTGHEPSLSCFHCAIDEAKQLLSTIKDQ